MGTFLGLIFLVQIPLIPYVASLETATTRTHKHAHIMTLIVLVSAFLGSWLMFGADYFVVSNASLFYLVSAATGLVFSNLALITERRSRSTAALIVVASLVIAALAGALIAGSFTQLFYSWSFGGINPEVSKAQLGMLCLFPLALLVGNYMLTDKK